MKVLYNWLKEFAPFTAQHSMSGNKWLKCVFLILPPLSLGVIPARAQDTTLAGLKGKVQTVLTENFTSDEAANRQPNGSTLDVYDWAGYELESFLYKPDGSLWARTVYSRNGPRVLGVDVTGNPPFDTAPFEVHSERTFYDAEGHESEHDVYDANGVLISKTTHELIEQHPNLLISRRTETTPKGETTWIMTETTDPKTGITRDVETKNGHVDLDLVSQRNANGTKSDKAVEPDGSYTKSERNRSGGLTAQDQYDAATKTHYYTKFAQGHTVEMTEKSNSHYIRYEYSFDETGQPTGQVNYDASGNILDKSTAEYRDDSHGNWIEKKSIVWNTKIQPMRPSTVKLTLRTISYY